MSRRGEFHRAIKSGETGALNVKVLSEVRSVTGTVGERRAHVFRDGRRGAERSGGRGGKNWQTELN